MRTPRRRSFLDLLERRPSVPVAPAPLGGVEGTPGADGSKWHSGSGAPSAELGANGDFYLRTSNGGVYAKSGGSWSVVDNLTGSAGADGEDGADGSPGEAGPAGTPSGIVHDTASQSAAGTGNLEWTHTPTIALPKGVLVLVAQNAETGDQVSGVTYGGVEMEEVPLSPEVHTEGSEDGALYGYFLGKGIPSGAQTVKVTVSGAASKRAVCFTVNGPKDTRVIDTTIIDQASGADPSLSVTTRTGEECAVYGLLHSGQNAESGIAAGAGYTDVFENDFGNQAASWIRRTANSTGGSVTVGWTATTEEAGAIGVAIGCVHDFGRVTALPAVAGKDDRCSYRAAEGVYWDLLYTAEATLPWAKQGGPPLVSEIATAQGTKSVTPTGLATAGPEITVPLAGDYDVEISTQQFGGATNAWMSYKVGGTGASNADGVQLAGGGVAVVHASRKRRKTGLAAGTLLLAQYWNEGGGAVETLFNFRHMKVDPVRVG